MSTTHQVAVLAFPSQTVLTKALDRMAGLDYVHIRRGAIVAKTEQGESIVLEENITPDEGGLAGGTVGAAVSALGIIPFGALALPALGSLIALGTAAVVGGFIGRLAGRFAAQRVKFGFKNEQLHQLIDQLQAGTLALVLDLRHGDTILSRLHDDLRPYHFEVIQTSAFAAA